MADDQRRPPGETRYAGCPYCTMQIPADALECPHCRKPLPSPAAAGGKRGKAPSAGGARRSPAELWALYGRWIKAAGPIVLALVVFYLMYEMWGGPRVTVVPNVALPVKAKQAKRDKAAVVSGTVTNEGEDVPDLSLKSIGVAVELVYRDGRREKRTVFPKAPFRGEGALLRGETGGFEIEAPFKGLEEVVLRSEIVDLGADRNLVPPGGRRIVIPSGKAGERPR